MGHRLSKIYTKTGDQGTTGMGDGSRLLKNDIRIEAIGTVDELNSHVGLLLAIGDLPDIIRSTLTQVQHHLFDVGAELCIPTLVKLQSDHTLQVEQVLDALNAELPMLKEFILPGGSFAAAQCHVARAVCRRAERVLVSVHQQTPLNPATLTYLNRLSDLLFVMARAITHAEQVPEVMWQTWRSSSA